MKATSRRSRRGFSLIEIMIAMTITAVVLLSLGRLTTVVASRGRTNDIAAKRNAILQQEANKFGAMPYSTLAGFSTASRTVTSSGFTYTRRLTITPVSTNFSTVKIVIVPARDTTKKDSVILSRSQASSTPLCKGC